MHTKTIVACILYIAASLCSLAEDTTSNRPKTPSDRLGIDQTEIIGRIATNYVFVEKDNGTKRHNLGTQFEKDLSKSIKVGIGLPITYAEDAQGEDAFGIGDVRLNGGWRFFHSPKFSALLSAGFIFDTSTDDLLGDGNNRLTGGLVGSWRPSKWLFSLATGWTFSDDSEKNEVTLSPLIGYQPMAKYLSYVTVGPSYSYGLETYEDALGVTLFLGKLMKNKDVFALGTQYNIEGVDDNKAFLLLSWRRLF